MPNPIPVRKAVSADALFLVECNLAMALETEGKSLSPEILAQGVGHLLIHPELGFYLVAEKSGIPAGCLMITYEWSDWRNGPFWWIQSVYVKPEFRRQGVYRSLHRRARSLARAGKKVCGLRLYVEKDNARARKTYRALGMGDSDYRMLEEPFSPSDA